MPASEEQEGPSPDIIISGGGIVSEAKVGSPTVWRAYPFAPEWFEDAVRESREPIGDHNARRREIIFAVGFSESYLYEWAHGEVLDSKDYQNVVATLNELFPSNDRRAIDVRWKAVTKKLREECLIPDTPNFNQPYWKSFTELVDWRNGLVHARSSRPETTIQPKEEKPVPSKDDLVSLEAGGLRRWSSRW